MEELQARHRKEQRDLQSRITQKKKQASKKTRKGVNDECERLEAELRARQSSELAALTGAPSPSGAPPDDGELSPEQLTALTLQVDVDHDAVTPENNHEPSLTATVPPKEPPANGPRKPNRQKARLARRAAEQASLAEAAAAEARDLPDRKAQERARMLEAMAARQLREIEIRADGHCLYSAFADQLSALELPLVSPVVKTARDEGRQQADDDDDAKLPAYRVVRHTAAGYISSHGGDFEPFLEEGLDDYVRKVRDTGEWGGQMELLALAATYGVSINVLQDFGRVEKIEPPAGSGGGEGGEGGSRKEVWLGYYKHGFGLGEHYNSLRKVGS